MDDIYEQLSDNPTIDALRLIIGDDAVLSLSEALGGLRVYFPYHPGKNSPVAVAVGLDNAIKIGNIYGGMHMDVPITLGKKSQILEMLAKGHTIEHIAIKARCTIRRVYQIKSEIADNKQTSLFD